METLSNGSQENPDAAKWQNLGGEQETPKLNPEQLRETAKMIEKLGDMGADSRILENPTFAKILGGGGMLENLRLAKDITINSDEGKDLKVEYLGSRATDGLNNRGEISFSVQDNGSLVISSANAKRSVYNLHSLEYNSEMRADGDFTETKFTIGQSGNLFVNIESYFDEELFKQGAGYHPSEGYRAVSGASERRSFDDNGIEGYRERCEYKTTTTESGDKNHFLYLKTIDDFNREAPKRLPNSHQHRSDKIVSSISITRNEDGTTAKVHAYDGRLGDSVDIKNCRINDEFGTDELLPENGAIAAAFEAKKEELSKYTIPKPL